MLSAAGRRWRGCGGWQGVGAQCGVGVGLDLDLGRLVCVRNHNDERKARVDVDRELGLRYRSNDGCRLEVLF